MIIIRETVADEYWYGRGEKGKAPRVVTCVGCPDMGGQGVESLRTESAGPKTLGAR